jgi:TolA-binding protein
VTPIRPGTWRRPWREAVIGLALLAFSPTAGAAREDLFTTLDTVDTDAKAVAERVGRLEAQVAPGRGFISEQQALERYQDYVYLHMIGEHELAAEGFFTLVTTAALGNAGLHRDAEWYLAESLYLLGNVATAEARYLVIADDAEHPFREDAVRRLLELYAETGQDAEFDRYYRQEILNGRVRPSDMITYSLAKSFFTQARYAESREQFVQVAADSPHWGKAQYYLGAIDVLDGNLDAAIAHFEPVTALSVTSNQERQLVDLACLALGRIYYERSQFDDATRWYQEIGGDSDFLADKLYEMVWTFIKQGSASRAAVAAADPDNDAAIREAGSAEYLAALDAVEIFLIRYPEHEYAAQLHLLAGHLRMEKREYDAALTAYEGVVADYAPIRDRFASLATSAEDTQRVFEHIVAAERTGIYETEGLPGYAVAMMAADKELGRALRVFRDLDRQEAQLAASEGLIAELQQVLGSDVGLGGFEHLRYAIALQQERAVKDTLDLMAAEEAWLLDASPDARRLVPPITARREALAARMAGISDDLGVEERARARERYFEELSLIESQVTELRGQSADLEAALSANPNGPEATRVRVDLDRVGRDLEDVLRSLEELRAAGPRSDWETRRSDAEGSFAADVAALRRDLRDVRRSVTTTDRDLVVARVDGLYATLEHSLGRLSSLRTRLSAMESSELSRIRARFAHEVREVAAQKTELELTLDQASGVSQDLTRSGFGRLEEFFDGSILRADMGIVDVYWTRTLDIVDQRTRVATEKTRLVRDLEARFDVIRQKLGSQ